MGLDMYLEGHKYLHSHEYDGRRPRSEDGFKVGMVKLELGYWRKHPDLHGFIVNNFAGGVDDCRDIDLSVEQLKELREAACVGALPRTEGFFFGNSYRPEDAEEDYKKQVAEDVEIIDKAIAWVEATNPDDKSEMFRSIVYRASW